LGTTLTRQPAEFGEVLAGRKAKISGGVLASRPGQKGQLAALSLLTVLGLPEKSSGRLARSVAIITHSLVAMLYRSSGIELSPYFTIWLTLYQAWYNKLMRLKRVFFTRPALNVAKEVLGKQIVRIFREQKIIGRIVEVEVYYSTKDRASHAYEGKVTKRNQAEYLRGGHVYIYLVYGLHWQFNISTGPAGHPECLLIRAVEPVQGFSGRAASGPGKFCKVFHLNKTFYGEDLVKSKRLWIEKTKAKAKTKVVSGPRIGIDYAGPYWSKIPWRFWIKDNKFISK
jgi:DNA-3-methyladenine glycosylase